MRQDEVLEFQRVLSGALSLWRQDVSEFALTVWWEACKGYSIEQVSKALTTHAMDPERGRFPPMPADIVKALHGTHTDRSLVAWGTVHRAIGSVGMYGSPDFGDKAIHSAIVDLGGWPAICQAPMDELPFLQRRFCELFRAYSSRPDEAHADRLVGMHEQANAGAGLLTGRPVMIGKRASQALEIEDGREQTRH
jgi:hypothetical protein